MAIYVGIEMSRELRLTATGLVPAGTLEAGGVNLLRHALMLARKLTEPGCICVLTVEPDENVLELVGEFECRESGVMQWVAQLVDLAPTAESDDAVIILRQTVPFMDVALLHNALKLLKKQRCVVSASKPPAGFVESRYPRQKTIAAALPHGEPLANSAFELWRLGEFGKYGFSGPIAEPPTMLIDWNAFVEIERPEDFARAAQLFKSRT